MLSFSFVSVATGDTPNGYDTRAALTTLSLPKPNKVLKTIEDLGRIDSRPVSPSHKGNFKCVFYHYPRFPVELLGMIFKMKTLVKSDLKTPNKVLLHCFLV